MSTTNRTECCFQMDDLSGGNDNSHNLIDSNNEDDDDDDDGEAADMEEFEESGMLEMVDPVSFCLFRSEGSKQNINFR